MTLEKASSWRFAVENVRFELFATDPVIAPFWPLYTIEDSTKLLRKLIASTEEMKTCEL
jgi:hypothetical protein